MPFSKHSHKANFQNTTFLSLYLSEMFFLVFFLGGRGLLPQPNPHVIGSIRELFPILLYFSISSLVNLLHVHELHFHFSEDSSEIC